MDVGRTVQAVWKLESARIIAGLTRLVHDVGRAEEFAQDAVVAALEQWPRSGVPDNPAAWLMTTAKRRAIDDLRRTERLEQRQAQLAATGEPGLDHTADAAEGTARDDVLRLIFLTCHPLLHPVEQVALTLRLVAGLTAAEIARAFLTHEAQINQRIASAKRRLAEARASLLESTSDDRLPSVLGVVYLIFNEGYSATAGDDLIRADLCREALRLGRMLAELAPREAEVHGLVALMEIQASRTAARAGLSGEPIPLAEQDRTRWDPLLIGRGFAAMLRARDLGGRPGPYVLQAAIAICHAQARRPEDTDWAQIATLYDALITLMPTPIVQLNRAVAIGRARGPQAGLALVDALVDDPVLRDYHLLPSVRGDLLARLGRTAEARLEFERAAALTANVTEQAFLRRRAEELPAVPPAGPTLGAMIREFLGRDDLNAATRRSYGQTLHRLARTLGEQLALDAATPERVARAFELAWGRAAARTWNRNRSAVRSFAAWAGRMELTAGLDRRPHSAGQTEPIAAAALDALWRLDLPLRERTLWRLLSESAAPVTTVLALNIEYLDLADRRARVGRRWVAWRSETAALLPELTAGRSRGPLFLTDRRPGPAATRSPADRCPHTGRQRLSYERAEYLFKQTTRPLDPSGQGYTLRQLRGSPDASRARAASMSDWSASA
jgi:RNA polymerase sigma factor (sigma-70 family)